MFYIYIYGWTILLLVTEYYSVTPGLYKDATSYTIETLRAILNLTHLLPPEAAVVGERATAAAGAREPTAPLLASDGSAATSCILPSPDPSTGP